MKEPTIEASYGEWRAHYESYTMDMSTDFIYQELMRLPRRRKRDRKQRAMSDTFCKELARRGVTR